MHRTRLIQPRVFAFSSQFSAISSQLSAISSHLSAISSGARRPLGLLRRGVARNAHHRELDAAPAAPSPHRSTPAVRTIPQRSSGGFGQMRPADADRDIAASSHPSAPGPARAAPLQARCVIGRTLTRSVRRGDGDDGANGLTRRNGATRGETEVSSSTGVAKRRNANGSRQSACAAGRPVEPRFSRYQVASPLNLRCSVSLW